jgi:UDP-N-acetylglucosamine 2-epimerase (non-hydrolysing)
MKKALKIINVVGARPNFMKIAPIMREMNNNKLITPILVHTGQHYDTQMSKLFFEELEIPRPDINLEVGSGSHAVQTAEIMKRFEPILLKEKPDYILIVGDVNSTIACALTASKLGIGIIHVEAGLRSFDRSMPEEINRVLTDALSDLLFITEESARDNLLREGVAEEKIFFVGNVMIDTLLRNVEKARRTDIHARLDLKKEAAICPYAVLTLHRPSNVDHPETLGPILEALSVLADQIPIIFPVHPRTRKNISKFGFNKLLDSCNKNEAASPLNSRGIRLIDPLGYLDFLHLMAESKLVLTDSGGMQEETTVLSVPCLTMRENTERPVTVSAGTNRIVGAQKDEIICEGNKILKNKVKSSRIPQYWDGKAANRIIQVLLEHD